MDLAITFSTETVKSFQTSGHYAPPMKIDGPLFETYDKHM